MCSSDLTSSFPVYDGGLFYSGELAELGGTLFFQATDGVAGYELWRSDGTSAGTWQVQDLTGDMYSSRPSLMHAVNGRLAFQAAGRLGLSDGTPAGTFIVPGSSAVDLATVGNQAFFLSQPDSGPKGLWKTDGTQAGTVPVAPLDTLATPAWMTASGGKLFFTAYKNNRFDLWVSDGTGPGTLDIDPGPGSSPQNLIDVGGTLFFSAFAPVSGLWKSDGTKAGTVLVKAVQVSSGPFAALPGGTLLFPANDFVNGQELWRSDGTADGTTLVKDVHPGSASSGVLNLTVVGNRAFFTANDGVHGLELWVSDGTAAGTHMVADIVPGADSSLPYNLTADGSVLVFTAFDPLHGMEAWRSDGTALGTRRLADVAPGPLSASPVGYTLAGNRLFFTADDNTTGFELWAIPQTAVLGTFADVPTDSWAWSAVEAIAAAGITLGCGDGLFCADRTLTRAEMGVFLGRGLHGAGFVPPPATGTRFTDVPASFWAADWIEQIATDGVTQGCSASPPRYCPSAQVSRAEMAVFLLRARHGGSYVPPPATGTRFTDVPAGYWAADWIEQLAAEGITNGCAANLYCPGRTVGRAEMAVFLARTFNLTFP